MTHPSFPQAAAPDLDLDHVPLASPPGTSARYAGAPLDEAAIRTAQLHALAELLSNEEVAMHVGNLSGPQQAALFGLFEHTLADVCASLERMATRHDAHEPHTVHGLHE